jgi:carboxyl-terminal processing protease
MNTLFLFMKRNYKILLAVVALSAVLWSFASFDQKSNQNDPEKDKLLLQLLTFVIERGHYDPVAIKIICKR